MKKVINFIGARWIFIAISIVLIAAGVVGFIVNKGFNYSIDFRPGLSQQFMIDPAAAKAPIAEVRSVLAPVGRYDLQVVGSAADQEFVIKVLAPGADDEFRVKTEAQIIGLLEGTYGAGSVTVQASDFVGPRYASELFAQTIWIMLVAIILILIYAAFRFKFVYGMAAVLCLLHDALFMLAVNAVFRIEFSTTTVAAVLTIIGYSINDTIVIFDRVRENRGLMAQLGPEDDPQHLDHPDPGPDHPDLDHRVPVDHRPVRAGQRRHQELRPADAGGHIRGRLLHDLHRLPDRLHVDAQGGPAAQGARPVQVRAGSDPSHAGAQGAGAWGGG